MTFGSLFAGAGGFDLGFEAAGMSCAFQVEIDQTARAVLARHWPDVPRFEDVRECGKKNLPQCDVLVFGFPCQDLSVAGQRKGLQGGTRSGLFYEAVRIGVELRCQYLVWENVPGLLSSDGGRDFTRVLRHLAGCGFHGGWRVLDAQHFGLAQRRRRVFGVFSRGRTGAERCAEVLALREGVRGHSAAGSKAGKGTAGRLAQCLRASGVGTERAGDTRGQDNVVVSPCLRTNQRNNSDPTMEARMLVTHTLTANGCDASEDGSGRGTPLVAFSANDYSTGGYRECDVSAPLTTNTDSTRGAPVIAFQERGRADGRSLESQENLSYALTAPNGGGRGQERNIATGLGVRRLTPRECERLQGWGDDHTRYRADGSEIADGPRYRLIGNGVAAPCAEWIARRLAERI